MLTRNQAKMTNRARNGHWGSIDRKMAECKLEKRSIKTLLLWQIDSNLPTRDVIQQTNSWPTHEGAEYRSARKGTQYQRHDKPILFTFPDTIEGSQRTKRGAYLNFRYLNYLVNIIF